jgi:hypothetical protein
VAKTDGVGLKGAARDYDDAIPALPALQARAADAEAETGRIEKFDLHEQKKERGRVSRFASIGR